MYVRTYQLEPACILRNHTYAIPCQSWQPTQEGAFEQPGDAVATKRQGKGLDMTGW